MRFDWNFLAWSSILQKLYHSASLEIFFLIKKPKKLSNRCQSLKKVIMIIFCSLNFSWEFKTKCDWNLLNKTHSVFLSLSPSPHPSILAWLAELMGLSHYNWDTHIERDGVWFYLGLKCGLYLIGDRLCLKIILGYPLPGSNRSSR